MKHYFFSPPYCSFFLPFFVTPVLHLHLPLLFILFFCPLISSSPFPLPSSVLFSSHSLFPPPLFSSLYSSPFCCFSFLSFLPLILFSWFLPPIPLCGGINSLPRVAAEFPLTYGAYSRCHQRYPLNSMTLDSQY